MELVITAAFLCVLAGIPLFCWIRRSKQVTSGVAAVRPVMLLPLLLASLPPRGGAGGGVGGVASGVALQDWPSLRDRS